MQFGEIMTKRAGKFNVTGRFIGTHKDGKKDNEPWVSPTHIQVRNLNKYNHKELERKRIKESLEKENGAKI